ncbi:unknown [Clostridium sp. CAG:628]|nr:unknown [Clostridium sp. CAG:628]
MENNEMKITVDGVTKTYRVILNLEDIDGKNFVIYTDDEKDEDGIKCYASKYVLNNGKLKLTQITDEKDYNFVCEVLNSIQNDGGKNEN